MVIAPFLAGVLFTIFAELLIMLISSLIIIWRANK